MPITLTALGSTLDITVIDQNFEGIQDLFTSGLYSADFLNQFKRFSVYRWVSGRIVSARTYDNPSHQSPDGAGRIITTEKFDITYRKGREQSADVDIVNTAIRVAGREHHAMELLGFPGPSFYYSFQEEGLNDPGTFVPPAVGWPTDMPDSHPASMCFSRWLSVHGASIKVFVPYPCVARVSGTATGSLTLFGMIDALQRTPANLVAPWLETTEHRRQYNAFRFGLIADTNPVQDGEFTNINQYVIDPATGIQSTWKTWDVFADQTLYASPRETFHLKSEVHLQGNKWYNFRFAFRDACHHGYVADNGAGAFIWLPSVWEDFTNLAGATNHPVSTSWGLAMNGTHPFKFPLINLWDSAGLDIEFDYARSDAWAVSDSDPSFAKGNYP